jgi:Flp pilus assembly protein TadG
MSARRTNAAAAAPAQQRGAALILVVVGMVAILGIAGLALDGGHAMLNKTRMQNTVDAAALAAAKTLDETADEALAQAAAVAMFTTNASGAGNRELAEAYARGDLNVTVDFSNTLNPFVAGSTPAFYARVRGQDLTLATWFSAVLGVSDKRVAASAVAGPSPTINQACNIMPMMVCGDPAAGAPFWGYTPGQPDVLKSSTRFGRYQGPMSGTQADYPPDVVTDQPTPRLDYDRDTDTITQNGTAITDASQIDYNYDRYAADVESASYDYQPAPSGIGAFQRREAAVAIGDCSETTNGQGEVPLLGFGCFFLLQEAQQRGNESYIYGQFLEDCRAGGMPGPEPTTVPGPYLIQLYRDYSSTDS